ncbi:MAG: DUF2779 domain-containing protein [Bdellovibrionales bacterium]|nr:DUF2779 domain-containing protein [Bdellovibrionales bacterium]
MDSLLRFVRDAQKACMFEGTREEFLRSDAFLRFCKSEGVIVRVRPQDLDPEKRHKFADHLRDLAKQFLTEHPEVKTWSDFASLRETRKAQLLIHEFGVRAELFNEVQPESRQERPRTNLTLPEFYELCQIQFNFDGSFGSFKKHVAKQFGSFAEYCLMKGYDINNTKWESDETAVRVARKLGSIEVVKAKSPTLFTYLSERDLLADAFNRKKFLLSKSRIMGGLQCTKNLYLEVHNRELKGEVSASQQAIFDQGHIVGLEAQRRYPGGVLIETPHYKAEEAAKETQCAIEAGAHTIYEATFIHHDVQVKVDILHRRPQGSAWQLIEVKSSTKVKDEHLQDVAIQTWVLEGVGIELASQHVMHLNSDCRHPNLDELFILVDVTKQISSLKMGLDARVDNLLDIVQQGSPPNIDIGSHCSDPYECSFFDHCKSTKNLPQPNVFDLPGLGSRAWKYYSDGIVGINDPGLTPKAEVTQRAIAVMKSGKRFVDGDAISAELEKWQWPLQYLDFETIGFAIPKFRDTGPYQQVPFQFSFHIQEIPGGQLGHSEYLHTDANDPREKLLEALLGSIKPSGSIIAYNKSFEAGCLGELAKLFPKKAPHIQSIVERLVDPLPIFRANVYDPAFGPSFSIKSVAPALIGESLSYKNLEVADGEAAQRAYLELIDSGTPRARKDQLRSAMLKYCHQDTLAMVKLVEWLFSHSSKPRAKLRSAG